MELGDGEIADSLAIGVFHQQRQVGFARVTTDYAAIGYIADLFVIPEYQGRGLSKLLIREILAHPKLAGVRRFLLATRDAHGLYARFGFKPLAQPDSFMTFQNPNAHPSPTG